MSSCSTAGVAGGPVTIAPGRDKGYLGSALNVLGARRNSVDARGEILSAYTGAHADRKFGFYLECMYERDDGNIQTDVSAETSAGHEML